MTATHLAEKHVAALDPANGILIGGSWRGGDRTFDVEDPATCSVIAAVTNGTLADATAAVDAAAGAWTDWRRSSPRARSAVLWRAFELMHARAEMLAALIMAENGKTERDAHSELTYAAEFFRWFAEEAVRSSGAYGEAPAGGTRTIVTHRPVGVAALITPWNFPAAMVARKVAPALAAGCSVVLKPAAETPLTALALARLLIEAGAPPGVVNVVPTLDAPDVVGAWLADPRVRKVSFTGSTPVGRVLLGQAAQRVVNSSMELGGNAPFVVTEDADIDAAVRGAMAAKFRNGGQACTAANRFYVHDDIAEDFTARLGRSVEGLRVGSALDPATDIGPMISSRAVSRMEEAIRTAVEAGARVAHSAELPSGLAGHFVAPTVLADVAPEAQIVQEEVFGPVAPIVRWRSDGEVLTYANDSEYGLAAYVFAGDMRRALKLAEALDAGMVGINRGIVSDPSAPFGGVKQSGLGREGAREGLLEFTETQYLSVDWED